MAISNNRKDRDRAGFKENAIDGGTDRRTCDITAHAKLDDIITNGSILAGVDWDYVKVTYPNATTETYTFREGGSGGTVQATVTLVYTDSTKEDLDTAERT